MTNCNDFLSEREKVRYTAKNGTYEFTNEVQHYDKVLSLWENNIDISRWKTVVRLPDFVKAGNQSGKLQQLWIARRRQYRER